MTPLLLLALQITMSFVVFGLFGAWVALPLLARLGADRALSALLWVHVFRYVPLALYAPGQVSTALSPAVVHTIAWGDFLSATLAIVAIVGLRRGASRARPLVWLFSIASSLDIVAALALGLGSGVYLHALGVSWFVLILYVPLVCVSQALVFVQLARSAS